MSWIRISTQEPPAMAIEDDTPATWPSASPASIMSGDSLMSAASDVASVLLSTSSTSYNITG